MKVLLINPSWRRGRAGARRYARAWPPLDLLSAAALLRDRGHEPVLIDARATGAGADHIAAAARRADLVLLQTSPLDRWQCPELDWRYLKEMTKGLPKDRLVVAGAHGTVQPEPILDVTGARILIRGEPEGPLAALADGGGRPEGIDGISFLDSGRVKHLPDQLPMALDALLPPAYDLVDPVNYRYELLGPGLALLETSRGCPYNCRFCLKAMYGPGVRYKSPDRVMEEIRLVVDGWGARHVYFIDLEFTLRREAVLTLCREIEKSNRRFAWCCQTRVDAVDPELLMKMKAAGCRLIHFGIESGHPEVLAHTGKQISLKQARNAVSWCRDLGLATACFFLFGLAGEGPKERRDTLDLAKRLNPTYASFHVAAPYPGTDYGRVSESSEPFPVCLAGASRAGSPAAAARHAFFSFYLRPRYLLARLGEGSFREKLNRLRVFWGFVR